MCFVLILSLFVLVVGCCWGAAGVGFGFLWFLVVKALKLRSELGRKRTIVNWEGICHMARAN